MKTAAKVFIIIGLVCSVIVLIFGIVNFGASRLYLYYGIYACITSIGSLVSINGTSKPAVNAWAIFYIPVVLLASIFMFCVKEENLY